MQRTKYAPEFKDEAVKQVIDKGHSVVDVAKRLRACPHDVSVRTLQVVFEQSNQLTEHQQLQAVLEIVDMRFSW